MDSEIKAVVAEMTPVENPTLPETTEGKSLFLMVGFCVALVVGAILMARRLPIAGLLAIVNAVAGLGVLISRLARNESRRETGDADVGGVSGFAPVLFTAGFIHAGSSSTWCCCRFW